MGRKLGAWKQAAETPDGVHGMSSNRRVRTWLSKTAQRHQYIDLTVEKSIHKFWLLPRLMKGFNKSQTLQSPLESS